MTFDSVYQILNPLSVVRKQHFWEWFDGAALDSRWTFYDIVGTNSGAMEDSIDGGYAVTTGTTNNDRGGIWFNGINQYAFDGSVFFAVVKNDAIATNTIETVVGLSDDMDIGLLGDGVGMRVIADVTQMRVGHLGTETVVSISFTEDTNYHVRGAVLKVSSVDAYID